MTHPEEATNGYAFAASRYGIDSPLTRKAFRTLTIESAKAEKETRDLARNAKAARFNAAVHGRAIIDGKGVA